MSHRRTPLDVAGAEGSHNFQIRTHPTTVGDLKSKDFQKKEAHRMFEWLVKNLPAGIYDELFHEMKHFEHM